MNLALEFRDRLVPCQGRSQLETTAVLVADDNRGEIRFGPYDADPDDAHEVAAMRKLARKDVLRALLATVSDLALR